MITELKQAAQQAVDAFDAFGEDDDFASLFALEQKMKALHTAIQQAEAKTDEPVFFVSPEQARAVTGKNRVHYTPSDNSGRYLPVRATPAGLFAQPLYTHPAQGVPDDVARDAISTVREQYRGTDWGKAAECICDAIDAAMLTAAQAQKGQP